MDRFKKVEKLIEKARESAENMDFEIPDYVAMEHVDITPVAQEAIGPDDPEKTHRGYVRAKKNSGE